MYLHNNRLLFAEAIEETNIRTGIAHSIIEKDYYVTMLLKLLTAANPEIVFKGGTSLSKCFHLIDRFSEDIDITFTEHIGEAKRKKLKYSILKSISEELHMPIENWDSIESDKDYNYYLFQYQPVTEYPTGSILSGIKLETQYGLAPFRMQVQSVNRTFIDKIYALCDYYMGKKTKRFSRHLYDIYKLYPVVTFDDTFKELICQVREHRSHLSICPSAQPNINIKALIYEFLDNEFYRHDYESITKTLISDHVTYEQTAQRLREIADTLF